MFKWFIRFRYQDIFIVLQSDQFQQKHLVNTIYFYNSTTYHSQFQHQYIMASLAHNFVSVQNFYHLPLLPPNISHKFRIPKTFSQIKFRSYKFPKGGEEIEKGIKKSIPTLHSVGIVRWNVNISIGGRTWVSQPVSFLHLFGTNY